MAFSTKRNEVNKSAAHIKHDREAALNVGVVKKAVVNFGIRPDECKIEWATTFNRTLIYITISIHSIK